jgi:hypothetical protein
LAEAPVGKVRLADARRVKTEQVEAEGAHAIGCTRHVQVLIGGVPQLIDKFLLGEYGHNSEWMELDLEGSPGKLRNKVNN